MNIAEKIEAAEQLLVTGKDLVIEKTNALEADPDNDQLLAELDEATARVEKDTHHLESLKRAEKALANRAEVEAPNVISRRDKSVDGLALFNKHCAANFMASYQRKSLEQVLNENPLFAADDELHTVVKAASTPATTTQTGWAAELVDTRNVAFLDALRTQSAAIRLPTESVMFNGFGIANIVMETDAGSTMAGAFVKEGDPIPTGKTKFENVQLMPYYLKRMSLFSNELVKVSDPQISAKVGAALIRRTAEMIDTAFFGNAAAVANTSPAGITNGIAGADTAASTGATVANIQDDLKARIKRLVAQRLTQRPVWVMHEATLVGLRMALTATGDKVYADELNNSMLAGFPVITSHSVPAAEVFLIDAAAIATAIEAPAVTFHSEGTIHDEDTAPKQIVTGGATADPVISLLQTDQSAARIVQPASWVICRAGAVQQITAVAW